MNNSFWTWVIAAGVGALVLVLLIGLGTPMENEVGFEPEATSETLTYWEPVGDVQVTEAVVTPYVRPVPCPSCGISTSVVPCPSCVSIPETSKAVQFVGGCPSSVVGPCAEPPCYAMGSACGPCPGVCDERPRINRNMPMCVDECEFIQLHSTIRYPFCDDVRFEWSATRGHFLDPSSSAPLYYAPATRMPGGETVWIILSVTDGQGHRYTDQLQLRVNNVD